MEQEQAKQVGMPLIGDRFPEMEVVTTHGPMNLPGDLKGKWMVLFSHPADFTPVCTTEFHAFATRSEEFEKLGAKLVGLSIDQVFSHIKWVQWIEEKLDTKIPFAVIADDRGVVSEKLGMLHPGQGSNTVRAVFIVNPDGILRLVLYYPQEIGRNMDEILRALQALIASEKHKVAIPANWPANELIGERVIVPPATNVEDAAGRLDEYEGYDWWFVHKELPGG